MINVKTEKPSERVAGNELPIKIPSSYEGAQTASQRVAYLLSAPHESLPAAADVLKALERDLPIQLRAAFADNDPALMLDVHKALFIIYEVGFLNPLAPAVIHEHSPWLARIRTSIEKEWLDYELSRIENELPAPDKLESPQKLCDWFISQASRESKLDRRVVNFLKNDASVRQFEDFILAETQLNYRFYDALVLAMLHYSEFVKTEISHHMWDECGCGDGDKAHTRQFTRALKRLNLPAPWIPIWENYRPYAGYNLYLCFGLNRRHYFKALGSLAMPELFDPDRDRAVIAGFERLNFRAPEEFEYYFSHIGGDEEHGKRWLSNIIAPIVAGQPETARELALGGALRMEAMRRYNEYLAEMFGLL